MADNKINVGGRLHSIATGNVLAGADEILDDSKGKKQSEVNIDIDNALADRYTKAETYNKSELNSLITTPDVQYVTAVATEQTSVVTDILPSIGASNTIYRVGKWDGTQYSTTVHSEYAWDGNTYVLLDVKEYGIDDEPTAGSNNFVKSGGIFKNVSYLSREVHEIKKDINLNNQEDSFNIADEDGNIAFRIDKDGVKAKLYNICDENGTIIGQIKIKNNLGAFRIVDYDFNIGFEVDSNGAKSRLYNICDEDGNIVAKIGGNTGVFKIVDGNYDAVFQIDSDGVKARHYNICDEDGNIIYTISENNIDNIIDLDTDKIIKQKSTIPLSIIKENMGFMPMFPNFGFIGDSLTSGYLAVPNVDGEKPVTNGNIYHSSWGQIICRLCGIDGTNFSVGGTTAKSWLNNYPNNPNANGYNTLRGNVGVDFSNDKKSAYTICLGTNDFANNVPLGNISTDVDVNDYANNNQNTFAGQYATIISKCKELCPSAKIFLITPFMWWSYGAQSNGYNDIVRQLAELFPKTYLIDLANYGINQNYSMYELGAHCSAMGNVYVAYVIANAIELIIRQNPNDFEMHTAIDYLKNGFDNGIY